MTKDRASAKAKPSAVRGPNAASLRSTIEKADRELAKLMNERAKASEQLAKLEPDAAVPAASLDEALERAAAHNKGPLPDGAVRSVFRELVSATRALQETLRVAFLGPAYSYSHLATLSRFGQGIEPVPV